MNISTQTEQPLQHHNREQSISNSKQTQTTSENRESKIAQQDSNTNSGNIQQIDITVGPTKETEPITNKNISNTKTISEELKELRETATTTFVNNTNTNINPKNIRIIDNIPPNLQPKSSSDIKKRIKEYTKEEITVDYTYILPKGGIVIHLSCTADIDILEQELNNIYPGTICNPPKSQLNIKKVIIKNIEPNIQLEDLTNEIKTTFPDCTKIRRFHSAITHKPLPIICITCTTADTYEKLIQEGVQIFNNKYKCEIYRKPVIRCFNCQRFGHIARNCINKTTCHHCGEHHYQTNYCRKNLFCINCKKPGHPSISRNCPKYIEKQNQIQHEISTVQHYLY